MKLLAALISALALAAGACTDDTLVVQVGIQLRMTATIPAHAEVEYCQFVTVPETWVHRDRVEFSAGSHHVLIFQTTYAEVPTQKDDGTPVDTSGVFDCSDGASNGWSVTKIVGGSQNQSGESILALPAGIGMRLGGVLMINAHYRNGSDAPLTADVKVTYDTMAADEVQEEGDILFLFNPLISVPPGQTSRARWRCPVYRDITIANAQSHMHARGIGFEARIDDGAPFYATERWEGIPVRSYDALTVKAGSVLDYQCDYLNIGVTPVYMGPRTTDEMCSLVASYYPADPRTSLCLGASGELFGGDWIGQGAATCGETMACMAQTTSFEGITDCMLAASPAVSRESSALLRCQLNAEDPEAECAAQVAACAAH